MTPLACTSQLYYNEVVDKEIGELRIRSLFMIIESTISVFNRQMVAAIPTAFVD